MVCVRSQINIIRFTFSPSIHVQMFLIEKLIAVDISGATPALYTKYTRGDRIVFVLINYALCLKSPDFLLGIKCKL